MMIQNYDDNDIFRYMMTSRNSYSLDPPNEAWPFSPTFIVQALDDEARHEMNLAKDGGFHPWENHGIIMRLSWDYNGIIMGFSGIAMALQWDSMRFS